MTTVPESEIEILREYARRVRAGLRLPFAAGLSEDELVAAARNRAGGKRPRQDARTLMLAIAKERQDDTEKKYRRILVAEARGLCEKRGIPRQRLDGEDLANDVLMKAAQRHGEFRGRSEGEYVSWLLTILDREALNRAVHHKAAIRDAGREALQPVDDAAPSPVVFEVDSQRSSPSENARTTEFVNAVADLLSTLNEREMLALELRYIRGVALAEVERALGLTKRATAQLCGTIDRRLGQVRGLAEGIRASKFCLDEIVQGAWNLRRAKPAVTTESGHERA